MAEPEEENFQSGASGSAECRGTLFMTSVSHSPCQAPCSSDDTLYGSGTGDFFCKLLFLFGF